MILRLSQTQWLILPAGLLVTENADGTITLNVANQTIIVSPPYVALVRRQLAHTYNSQPPVNDPANTWNGVRANM